MKEPKILKQFGNKSLYSNSPRISTKPQTALELNQNILATHSTNSSISKSFMSSRQSMGPIKISFFLLILSSLYYIMIFNS
jgi:hypothetical protein